MLSSHRTCKDISLEWYKTIPFLIHNDEDKLTPTLRQSLVYDTGNSMISLLKLILKEMDLFKLTPTCVFPPLCSFSLSSSLSYIILLFNISNLIPHNIWWNNVAVSFPPICTIPPSSTLSPILIPSFQYSHPWSCPRSLSCHL